MCVVNCASVYSAQNGEPCHRSLERKDKPHEYSQALSQRSNPNSVHKNTLIDKKKLIFEGQTAK